MKVRLFTFLRGISLQVRSMLRVRRWTKKWIFLLVFLIAIGVAKVGLDICSQYLYNPENFVLPSSELAALRLKAWSKLSLQAGAREYFRARTSAVTSVPGLHLQPSSPCRDDTFLVALVTSPADDELTRDVIRQTWGRAVLEGWWPGGETMKVKVRVVFVLGMPQNLTLSSSSSSSPSSSSSSSQNSPSSSVNSSLPKSPQETLNPSLVASESSTVIAKYFWKVLVEESKQHDDLILGDFLDSYRNLSLKTLTGLSWATKGCSSARFIMKVDQDTLVDFPRLTDYLLSEVEKEQMVGSNEQGVGSLGNPKLSAGSPVIDSEIQENLEKSNYRNVRRSPDSALLQNKTESWPYEALPSETDTHLQQQYDPHLDNYKPNMLQGDPRNDQKATRKFYSGNQPNAKRNAIIGRLYFNSQKLSEGKWGVSENEYPFSVYPTFAAGPCYLLTQGAAERIVQAAPYYPVLPLEDVLVTGILAEAIGVERLHLKQVRNIRSEDEHPCELVGEEAETLVRTDNKLTENKLTDNKLIVGKGDNRKMVRVEEKVSDGKLVINGPELSLRTRGEGSNTFISGERARVPVDKVSKENRLRVDGAGFVDSSGVIRRRKRTSSYITITALSRVKLREAWEVIVSGSCFGKTPRRPWTSN